MPGSYANIGITTEASVREPVRRSQDTACLIYLINHLDSSSREGLEVSVEGEHSLVRTEGVSSDWEVTGWAPNLKSDVEWGAARWGAFPFSTHHPIGGTPTLKELKHFTHVVQLAAHQGQLCVKRQRTPDDSNQRQASCPESQLSIEQVSVEVYLTVSNRAFSLTRGKSATYESDKA